MDASEVQPLNNLEGIPVMLSGSAAEVSEVQFSNREKGVQPL